MKKTQIRNIIPHFVQDECLQSLSDRIADLHIQVIKRWLDQSGLTAAQKINVVDRIIANLISKEVHSTTS